MTTVKVADAAQFLSLVPLLLGYLPTHSVVIVPMSRGKSLGAMRVDLPPDDAIDTAASTVIGMACRIAQIDGIVSVIYTDAAINGDLPHRALTDSLALRADACGLTIVDALAVGANGWGSYLDRDLPDTGRFLAEIGMVARTADHATSDQTAGAYLPRCPRGTRSAVSLALHSLDAALEVICGIPADSHKAARIDPAALHAACQLDDLPELFEAALRWDVDAMPPMQAAMLGWCLERPSLRDVALVQWASDESGGDAAMDAQRRWEDGEEYPSDLAEVMWGEGVRPDAERIEVALLLTRTVAATLPKKRRAGALAVCAWLSWALGRSTHADKYARMALHSDPTHGLAEIVASFVQAGHLPDWAFRTT